MIDAARELQIRKTCDDIMNLWLLKHNSTFCDVLGTITGEDCSGVVPENDAKFSSDAEFELEQARGED